MNRKRSLHLSRVTLRKLNTAEMESIHGGGPVKSRDYAGESQCCGGLTCDECDTVTQQQTE